MDCNIYRNTSVHPLQRYGSTFCDGGNLEAQNLLNNGIWVRCQIELRPKFEYYCYCPKCLIKMRHIKNAEYIFRIHEMPIKYENASIFQCTVCNHVEPDFFTRILFLHQYYPVSKAKEKKFDDIQKMLIEKLVYDGNLSTNVHLVFIPNPAHRKVNTNLQTTIKKEKNVLENLYRMFRNIGNYEVNQDSLFTLVHEHYKKYHVLLDNKHLLFGTNTGFMEAYLSLTEYLNFRNINYVLKCKNEHEPLNIIPSHKGSSICHKCGMIIPSIPAQHESRLDLMRFTNLCNQGLISSNVNYIRKKGKTV